MQAYAGKADGDNDGEVAAIEALIAAGAKGFMLVPSDSTAIVPTVEKARKAGLLVIMLDTPLDPINAADATFATDNFKAGECIGQWAKATLGDKAARPRRSRRSISPPTSRPSTISATTASSPALAFRCKNPKHFAKSDSPQIVGSDVTPGSDEGGRKAMENILQKASDIDVVYAINEPAADGGYAALKAAGKEKGVLVVAVDGGCPGVKSVKEGIIGATSQQYPLLMAVEGRRGDRRFRQDRQEAGDHPGLDFFDTGATLITDHPVPGVKSMTSEEGAKLCWG